ncbi:MAG: indolepyruvate oxidoreductase subunit beta family protein [Alphaproteobacteria bacterium]|nr:indolepyruvate oxidoreductase subunit beta family protein [Alphaproteobacteria bacterium]
MSGPLPHCILIAALGGEGGGVLTDWIVGAAEAEGFPVQSTSIPGVAQRTGATTYYIEIYPEPQDGSARRPVMALYPSPGHIDVMVASELLEAGRAIEAGFVSPDRTCLIASTHRIYSIAEKSAMGDGRFDTDRILAAADALARRPILGDLAAIAAAEGAAINAVILGVIAGSDTLPIPHDRYEAAIRNSGIAVEANLNGFRAGIARVAGSSPAPEQSPAPATITDREIPGDVAATCDGLPLEVREIAHQGVRRLLDYQDGDYARLYVERLQRVLIHDSPDTGYRLSRETARHLALWMSYEDVIRVAELKIRPERIEKMRQEVGAKPGEPVRITEFLKPSPEEVAAILPARLGRMVSDLTRRFGGHERWQRSMRIRTDRFGGFARLWLLSRMRRFRRTSLRFTEESAAIENWLDMVCAGAEFSSDLAVEIAECARLLKGYGDTYRRGRENYAAIVDTVIEPALAQAGGAPATAAVKQARDAALADPEGFELKAALSDANVHGVASINRDGSGHPAAPSHDQGGKAA